MAKKKGKKKGLLVENPAVPNSGPDGVEVAAPLPSPGYDYERDPRPESSPYTKDCCYLTIGPCGISYTVPTHYLERSPHFSSQLSSPFVNRKFALPELDDDIGHTLVHFLYTGEYQTLKRCVPSVAENERVEYKRSVLVYQAASAYELPPLMLHARRNIKKFDNAVSIFEVLDMAKAVYEKLVSGVGWFRDYLKGKLKNAFDADETLFGQKRFREYICEAVAFSRMLVKLMVEIYGDKLSKTYIQNDQADVHDKSEEPTCTNGDLTKENLVIESPAPDPEPEPEEIPAPEPESAPEASSPFEAESSEAGPPDAPAKEDIPEDPEPECAAEVAWDEPGPPTLLPAEEDAPPPPDPEPCEVPDFEEDHAGSCYRSRGFWG